MTAQLYLENTYLFESEARVLGHDTDDKGAYILPDQTIFYPQGGGQPSDRGKIIGDGFELIVSDVRQVENEIRHYIDTSYCDYSISEKYAVKCIIDKDRRLLNSRCHTAGHLLGNVVESKYPELKAQKCHAFPGEAYIEFQGSEMPNAESLSEALQNAIAKNLETENKS
jgi:alanyl-tRNA synthetase